MKTKILALIISILCLSVLLVACDKSCETHVDENGDGVCDKCEATVEKETETEIICDEHKDEDADKTCDACGKAVVIVTEYVTQATETETEINCDAHVDADADKVCDVCSKAVVVIVEKETVEAETKVDMIVNTAPETSKVEDYVNVELADKEYYTSATEIVGLEEVLGRYAYKITGEDGQAKHTVFDLATGKEIYTAEQKTTESYIKTYGVALRDYWFEIATIETEIVDGNVNIDTTVQIFTYTGKQIGENYVDEDGSWMDYSDPYVDYTLDESLCYVIYQNKYYVIDTETYDLVYTSTPDEMVKRPIFDDVKGNYGYVFTGSFAVEGVNVYDLTKWIDCVYNYTVPSYYDDAEMTVLDNGKILVWANVALARNAVSYDFIESGDKYDMVYVIVDPVAGTETEVEFGYAIDIVLPIEEDGGVFTAVSLDYNIARVYPVENGYVNYNAPKLFIVDNELNIICEINAQDVTVLVDDGVFLKEVTFNDGKYAYELVDVNGKHISYLSLETTPMIGYKIVGDCLVNYAGETLLDLSKYNSGYTSYEGLTIGNYIILFEEVVVEADDPETEDVDETVMGYKFYFYNPGADLKEIDTDKDNWAIENVTAYGYQISYTELREVEIENVTYDEYGNEQITTETIEQTVKVYEFYGTNNELLFKTDGALVYHFDEYSQPYLYVVYEDEDSAIICTHEDAGYKFFEVKK